MDGDQIFEWGVFATFAAPVLGLSLRYGGGFTGLAPLGAGLAALAAAGVLTLALGGRSSGRFAGGRSVSVHGHAHGPRAVHKHEAGHAVAARALGGSVISAEVYDNGGGLVQAYIPSGPLPAATFLYAGQIAAGTTAGAGADNDLIRRELRELPSAERDRVRAQARRDARRIVNSRSGEIRRDAARLNERGRL